MVFGVVFCCLFFLSSLSVASVCKQEDGCRKFFRTMNFNNSVEVVSVDEWAKSHVSCVKFLGDFLLRQVGAPTNVAVVRVGYKIKGNEEVFLTPLEKFFCSKTKLVTKRSRVPITMDHIGRFLQSKNRQSYSKFTALDPLLYKNYVVAHACEPEKKEQFKKQIEEMLEKNKTLPTDHAEERKRELKENRMDFFLHSEQGIVFRIIEDKDLWEKSFKNLKPEEKVSTIFINIVTYFDPCVRCGDTMSCLSERELLDSLKTGFNERGLDADSVFDNTKVLIETGGIFGYRDPILGGGRKPTLRPKQKDFVDDSLNPSDFIPKVACVAAEWLL